MKAYNCIKIFCPPDQQELLLASIDDADFEVYQETDDALLCYLPVEKLTQDKLDELHQELDSFGYKFEISEIPYQNWNEEWEHNFQPIEIEGFAGIRADFHPPFEDVKHDLIINPKMAFGTGHHETTYQMMEMMQHVNFTGKSVLDYGCGTGILGILASKLGASNIRGNDITEESVSNTIENCKINGVNNFDVLLGRIEAFKGEKFDIVLANINRNVLLDSAGTLFEMTEESGLLFTSGYMPEDDEMLTAAYKDAGYSLLKQSQRGYWLCHLWQKQ